MLRKAIIFLAFTMLTACTDTPNAVFALQNAGFTDIRMTGYKHSDCLYYQIYHSGFTAKNSQGKTVNGTVCSGFISNTKDTTIRFS